MHHHHTTKNSKRCWKGVTFATYTRLRLLGLWQCPGASEPPYLCSINYSITSSLMWLHITCLIGHHQKVKTTRKGHISICHLFVVPEVSAICYLLTYICEQTKRLVFPTKTFLWAFKGKTKPIFLPTQKSGPSLRLFTIHARPLCRTYYLPSPLLSCFVTFRSKLFH